MMMKCTRSNPITRPALVSILILLVGIGSLAFWYRPRDLHLDVTSRVDVAHITTSSGPRTAQPVVEAEFLPTRAPQTDLIPNPAGALPKFNDDAPFTIVIVDHNEKLLAKTVNEILKVKSQKLVHEVLILDDMSDTPDTYSMFVSDPRISVYRAKERLGLIRARIDGSNLAAGTFLVLIDAHCKPHEDWLFPVANSLRENYKRMVNMHVGQLDGETWSEKPGAVGAKATFYWSLTHVWEDPMSISEIEARTKGHDKHPDPAESPITMGMFAITKRWWRTIGGMDSQLSTWGGENIDISLRTWLCGGEIRVADGSRIDHAFRKNIPYAVDAAEYHRNLVRVAEAWMGPKYKERFYKAAGIQPGSVDFGSIQEQLDVQKRLKCKPFDWYYWKFFNRAPSEQPKMINTLVLTLSLSLFLFSPIFYVLFLKIHSYCTESKLQH